MPGVADRIDVIRIEDRATRDGVGADAAADLHHGGVLILVRDLELLT